MNCFLLYKIFFYWYVIVYFSGVFINYILIQACFLQYIQIYFVCTVMEKKKEPRFLLLFQFLFSSFFPPRSMICGQVLEHVQYWRWSTTETSFFGLRPKPIPNLKMAKTLKPENSILDTLSKYCTKTHI